MSILVWHRYYVTTIKWTMFVKGRGSPSHSDNASCTFSFGDFIKHKEVQWAPGQRLCVLDECFFDGIITGQNDGTVHTHIHGEHVTILTCQTAHLLSDVTVSQAQQTANQRQGEWPRWQTTWLVRTPHVVTSQCCDGEEEEGAWRGQDGSEKAVQEHCVWI